MTIREIYDYINSIAPFENQAKGDNSGLLVGSLSNTVKKALVCLDATKNVIEEAIDKECDLIITHHPIIYQPFSNVETNDPLYAIISNGINVISAHTNTDVAFGGLAEQMLERLGLPKSSAVMVQTNPDGTGFGRIAEFNTPLTAKELAERCKDAFSCTVVRYVDAGKPISRIGVGSGSAGDLLETAIKLGCDAFICGDVKNGIMVAGLNYGITVIDAGHFHTEDIFCEDLIARLKAHFPSLDVEKAANSIDVCSYL